MKKYIETFDEFIRNRNLEMTNESLNSFHFYQLITDKWIYPGNIIIGIPRNLNESEPYRLIKGVYNDKNVPKCLYEKIMNHYGNAIEHLEIYEIKQCLIFDVLVIKNEFRGNLEMLFDIFDYACEYASTVKKPIILQPAGYMLSGERTNTNIKLHREKLILLYKRREFMFNENPIFYHKDEMIWYPNTYKNNRY